MSSGTQVADILAGAAAESASRAAEALLRLQQPEDYWWAELTADSTLESDYILLQLWLHPPVDGVWNPPDRARIDRAVQSILDRQLPDGGFWIYPDGPADVSATVKAYFALKVAGLRQTIRAWCARGIRSSRWADCRPPTATSKSTSVCSDSIRAKTFRRFRPN